MASFKQEIREYGQAICETVTEEFRNWAQFFRETWPLLALLAAAVGVALWFAKPAPPGQVLMGTGSQGGSYELITQEYVKFFASHGVTLKLVTTPGAEENIARLSNPNDPLQAALVQSGLVTEENSKGLLSLGSIAYEPIWFFYRKDKFAPVHQLSKELLEFPMAIGEPGSGTHRQAMHLLMLNGFDQDNQHLKSLPSNKGVEAFINGEVDGVFLVDGFESANVQKMLQQENASLANFERAAAYTHLMPFFHQLLIPQGAFNLQRNSPPQDLKVVAPSTNLLIDKNMHPAIQLLFLQAAQKINGKRSFFSEYGEFPKFIESIVPESDVAKRFYEKGSPWLMNFLPFWLAEFIDRLFILLLPLFAFAYPLLNTMPSYRLNRARSRINEVYGALKFFEQDIAANYDDTLHQTYLGKLAAIEQLAQTLRVPQSLVSDYYSLRTNIDFVRMTINRLETNLQQAKYASDLLADKQADPAFEQP